jgi:hypothetical protein
MTKPIYFYIGKKRTIAAMIMLAIAGFFKLLSIVANVFQLGILLKVKQGISLTNTDKVFFASLVFFEIISHFGLGILCAIPFLSWFYQAYKNLLAFNVSGLKFSPGAAVGYFFFPILNLFYPFKIAKEIWHASDPKNVYAPESILMKPPDPKIIAFWWNAIILSVIFSNISNFFNKDGNPLMSSYATIFSMVANFSMAVAAVFAILMIKAINQRQQEKHLVLCSAVETA